MSDQIKTKNYQPKKKNSFLSLTKMNPFRIKKKIEKRMSAIDEGLENLARAKL